LILCNRSTSSESSYEKKWNCHCENKIYCQGNKMNVIGTLVSPASKKE
jgi:hypothetical protein